MNAGPASFTIRVDGIRDEHGSTWLGALDLTLHDDGTTTVSVPDQAHLYGVLAGLRDLGAGLLEVRPGPPGGLPRSLLDRPLHTARLVLRPATAADADPTWRYRRLPSVNEWLYGSPDDPDAYREMFSDPARLATTVVVTLGHDAAAPVIGDLMLSRADAWAQRTVADQARGMEAELGWTFDPAHTGHGFATEAVRELIRYCFQDLGVRRVTASCFLANTRSRRLMERVGMRCEQHAVRESLHRSGRWLDTVGYALLREEW